MSESKNKTLIIRGTLDWAKVIGKPRLNEYVKKEFGQEKRQWSVDITPDAKSRALLKANRLEGKLRTPHSKDSRKETFLTFTQDEFRKDGTPNEPITVKDAAGAAWPEGKLIGNGSVADIKFVAPPAKAGKQGMYIRAIRILKLVPYQSQEFEPLSEDDEYFASDHDDTTPQSVGEDYLPADDMDEAPY